MKDLRLRDNKALSLASEAAQKYGKNLVILHVLSPGDYKAHDRAPVRIDFVLRNLALLQVSLQEMYSVESIAPPTEMFTGMAAPLHVT